MHCFYLLYLVKVEYFTFCIKAISVDFTLLSQQKLGNLTMMIKDWHFMTMVNKKNKNINIISVKEIQTKVQHYLHMIVYKPSY